MDKTFTLTNKTLILTKRAFDLLAVLVLDSQLPLTVPVTEASEIGAAAGELVAEIRKARTIEDAE